MSIIQTLDELINKVKSLDDQISVLTKLEEKIHNIDIIKVNKQTVQKMINADVPEASGTIIPFASGTPLTVTTDGSSSSLGSAIVSFGNNVSGVTAIDLTNMSRKDCFAFSMPTGGKITEISAFFSLSSGLAIGSDVATLTAQLYSSTTNNFLLISDALVTLAPTLSGSPSAGTISKGIITGLNIEVTQGDRIIMVISASGAPLLTINGYFSGGVTILGNSNILT